MRPVAVGDGLIGRMLRALRLDATLYREVAGPGGSTWQAALVVLMAAVAAGTEVAWTGVSGAGLVAITHMAAWPVWAAGLWFVGARLRRPVGEAPGFRQVARAIAFAQAPGVFFASGLVLVSIPTPLWSAIRSLIFIWVLVGTFVALRETVGLSNGQTLGALFAVGAAIAVLVGPAIIFLTAWVLLPQVSMGATVATVSYGVFDFNLGLDLMRAVMRLLLPAAFDFLA